MATRFAPSTSILNFMASSPNYGKVGSTGAMENLKTAAQNLVSNAGIHSAGMYGNDIVEGADTMLWAYVLREQLKAVNY